MADLCPIECLNVGQPDFIEKHGTWLLTVVAGLSGCAGMMFTYLLKSRCSQIRCLGVSCVREVLALKPADVIITSSDTVVDTV